MTAAVAMPGAIARPAPVFSAYRFELVKLLSLRRLLVLIGACWIAPGAFVAVVSQQSALPADSVFGRWMHASAWAGSLVVLGFACSWALPCLTAVVAGDVFAAEDRLGTWRHLIVAVRSPRRIFMAKALASLTVIGLLVLGLAASGTLGGLVTVGSRPLVALDGRLLTSSVASSTVLEAWLFALAPTLAFAAVGLLSSVSLGRSPMGVAAPAVLALALAVAQLLPLPVAVRVALPSYAFIAWRGLLTTPTQFGPLLAGLSVSLLWAIVATALAYLLFRRRDFTDLAHDGAGRRTVTGGVLPLVALTLLTAATIQTTTAVRGSSIERVKVERSLSVAFAHLYRLQTSELHRPSVTEGELRASTACDKGGVLIADRGAGNDWRCVVTWHLPGVRSTGSAVYQLDITADGRFVADGDGPSDVNGFFQVRTPTGPAPNPLWQLDGIVDLLSPTKG